MRILVISDNHGDQAILNEVKAKNPDVDAIFHCGDSEGQVTDPFFEDTYFVRGNNDFNDGFPEEVLETIEDQTIYMTHGDHYGVNMDLTRLALRAKELRANMVFFGHTHKLGVEWQDDCLFVNPGSISLPRGEYASIGGTFAIVTATKTMYEVDYFDRNSQLISSLSTVIKR